MKSLLILGAGGHGKVVADSAEATGNWSSIIFLDDKSPRLARVGDWPVAGLLDSWRDYDPAAFDILVAVGDNATRLNLHEQLDASGYQLPVLIHPSAWVSSRAQLAAGCVVLAGGMINIDAQLGESAIVNTGASIDHDCHLGGAVHVSPGAHLGGGVRVGDLTWIGIGASIRQGISIGKRSMVGAGAAVVSNIPDDSTVMGVPARV